MVVKLSAVQVKVCNLTWMSSFMQLSMHMHEHGVPASIRAAPTAGDALTSGRPDLGHCQRSSACQCMSLHVTAKGLLHVWVT